MKMFPAAVLAAWLLPGCYFTSQVPPGTLRAAGEGLTGPLLLRSPDSTVLLEPGTMVRAHLADGGRTGWVEASNLRVTADGLMLGEPLRVSEVAEVKVADLDAAQVQLLRETAPTGGQLAQSWRFGGWYQLKAPAPEALAWARRFSERALAQGKAGGLWQLSTESGWERFDQRRAIAAQNLVEASGPESAFAPGLRWHQVSELEVRSLSPEFAAVSVPLFPIVLVFMALDSEGASRITSPTEGQAEGTLPMLTWSDPRARPLFTDQARRRAVIQGLATLDTQGTLGGDLAAGLSVGMRFRNAYEITAVARGISLAGPETRSAIYALGFGMGLHVDGDGDPGFAFSLGFDVTGTPGPSSPTAIQFKWGPRLGLGRSLFLTVSPLNLGILASKDGDGRISSVARVVASLELGGTL